MLCENCGKQLKDGVKFCNGCGSKQQAAAAVQPVVEPVPVVQEPPPAPPIEPDIPQEAVTPVRVAPLPPSSAPLRVDEPTEDKKNNILVIIAAAVIAILLAGLLVLGEYTFDFIGLFGNNYIPVGGEVTTTEVTTTATTTANTTTTTQTGAQTTTTTRPPTTTTTRPPTTTATTTRPVPRHPAPPRPTAQSVAPTQVVLHSAIPNPHNGTVQWRVIVALPPDLNMLTGWQPSPVFSNLTPGTMYTFQVRILGDGINFETSEEVANLMPIRTPG